MSDHRRLPGKRQTSKAGFKEPFLHFTYTVDM
jgi:hypothetical protein